MESNGSDLSFDILNKSDDYITSNFDVVYPILRKSLSDGSHETFVVRSLYLTFGPCLDLFTIDDLEEKLLKHGCLTARIHFVKNLKTIENLIRNGSGVVSKFLQVCEEIVLQLTNVTRYITQTGQTIKLPKVKSLMLCSTEVLHECYQHFIKSEECYGSHFKSLTESLAAFFKKAQELQFHTTQLLSKIEVNYDQCEIDVLNDILTFIYKSGMVVLNFDIKTMADLWKGYICALSKYSEYLKFSHEISVPLQCLTTHFINSLQNLISGDCKDVQNFDKLVKILCFILKIVIKICEKFNGALKDCQNSLVNLLVVLNRICDPHLKILDPSIENTDSLKQLVIGMDPLLNNLFDDMDFVLEFNSASNDIKIDSARRFSFLLLSCLIVKKLTFSEAHVRKLWFNSNDVNILSLIFNILESCNSELCLDVKFPGVLVPGKPKKMIDCFEYVLNCISPFLLTATSKEFSLAEQVLLKYVLQQNPWCAILASDIWCILARSSDAELCYNQVNNLCKLLNQFEKWPLLPEKLYLEALITRLFHLMSVKHKDALVKMYPIESYPHLWRVFDVQCLSYNVQNSARIGVHQKTINDANKFLSSDDDCGKVDFIKMESTLLASERKARQSNEDVENVLAKLWKFDPGQLNASGLNVRYIVALCCATSSVVPYMTSKNMLLVFQGMKSSLQNIPPSCKLYYLDNLDRMGKAVIPSGNSQATIFRLISSIFHELLNSVNVFVQTRCMEVFSNFASLTCHTQIISQSVNQDTIIQNKIANHIQRKPLNVEKDWKLGNYLRKLEFSTYKHSCECYKEVDDCDFEEPPSKKISLDREIVECSDVDSMISVLKSDAMRISRHAGNLTGVQRREILGINEMLSKMLE